MFRSLTYKTKEEENYKILFLSQKYFTPNKYKQSKVTFSINLHFGFKHAVLNSDV